jgi:hypothetical protein
MYILDKFRPRTVRVENQVQIFGSSQNAWGSPKDPDRPGVEKQLVNSCVPTPQEFLFELGTSFPSLASTS